MTKIYINLNDKNTNVFLNDAITVLNRAQNISLNVPGDFANATTINSIKNNIIEIKNNLNDIQTWLQNSQNDYNNFLNNLEINVSKIPNATLEKNLSIVK